MSGRLPEPALDPETRGVLEPYRLPDGRPLPIFPALAHSRVALDDLRRATAACLKAPSLEARTREIAILRICARAGADAEWAVHVTMFATDARLDDREIAATTAPGAESWPRADTLVIRLADEVYDTSTVSDGLWAELARTYSPQQIVELLLVVTQYLKVACLTNALALPVPDRLPRPPGRLD